MKDRLVVGGNREFGDRIEAVHQLGVDQRGAKVPLNVVGEQRLKVHEPKLKQQQAEDGDQGAKDERVVGGERLLVHPNLKEGVEGVVEKFDHVATVQVLVVLKDRLQVTALLLSVEQAKDVDVLRQLGAVHHHHCNGEGVLVAAEIGVWGIGGY